MPAPAKNTSFGMRLAVALSALLMVVALVLFWWAAGVARRAPKTQADQVVNVRTHNSACEPMEIQVPAGRTTFNLVNQSDRALEWEILDGIMVLEERENIPPGFTQSMTVKLPPGEFEITCGLLSNPHGRLRVTPSAASRAEAAHPSLVAFVGALAEYQVYLIQEADSLQEAAQALEAAIGAGDRAKAQALYGPAHQAYKHVEPIAQWFADLDSRLNARAEYFEKREQDPAFSGFHRIEYGLFAADAGALPVESLKPVAELLVKDVAELEQRFGEQEITPQRLADSAVRLLGRTADSLAIGEENFYSHSEPANLQATLEASKKIADLLAPLLGKASPALQQNLEQEFAAFAGELDRYRQGDDFKRLALDQSQRDALVKPIRALAAEMAKVNGALGLE